MHTQIDSNAVIHPAWLRLTHWLNAVAVVVLATSGWRIYNAAPFFPFELPRALTLGGWLGGALQWHFAAMWLLVANGLLVGATIALLSAFGAQSARWPLMIVLLLAGAVRSMQFTCLNTLVFADVPDRLRAPANTLASMAWEVASAAGVAVAALLLSLALSLRGAPELATIDFRWAFLLLGAVALAAAASFGRLPADAGSVVSGHRG